MDVVRAARGARQSRAAVPPAHARRRDRRMNAIVTIARRELRALFDHPTAYILLVVFTGVNGFLFFREVEMYGVASLRPMLDLLPWLLLFLAPAVTMRALAEDRRSGTLEVVLAQPITELELLLGKYAGQVLFLLIALALTLTLPIGLALGAHLALGMLVAQYVGAALLIAGLGAVGIWASSVTPNQITAFILAVAAMIVVNLLGRHIGGRLDLTPGRSYTLAPATKRILGALPDIVTIKLFASSALPPEVAFLKRDLDDLLRDYRAAGRGRVKLVVQDPSADSAALREARTLGIPAVQFNVLGKSELQVKEGYLGVAVRYADGVKTDRKSVV